MFYRFQDKAVFGYGTSIPPNNNEIEDKELATKKVIFCVHGKLSGCCTVIQPGTQEGMMDYNNVLCE